MEIFILPLVLLMIFAVLIIGAPLAIALIAGFIFLLHVLAEGLNRVLDKLARFWA